MVGIQFRDILQSQLVNSFSSHEHGGAVSEEYTAIRILSRFFFFLNPLGFGKVMHGMHEFLTIRNCSWQSSVLS